MREIGPWLRQWEKIEQIQKVEETGPEGWVYGKDEGREVALRLISSYYLEQLGDAFAVL